MSALDRAKQLSGRCQGTGRHRRRPARDAARAARTRVLISESLTADGVSLARPAPAPGPPSWTGRELSVPARCVTGSRGRAARRNRADQNRFSW